MRFVLLVVVVVAQVASAECPWKGTWLKRGASSMTLTAEPSGAGCKLTWVIKLKDVPEAIVATNELRFDGTDSPTMSGGKATPQSFAAKQIDARHWTSVLKYQGKQTGTGKTELSADGKVMTSEIETTVESANAPVGKQVEVWDKQK